MIGKRMKQLIGMMMILVMVIMTGCSGSQTPPSSSDSGSEGNQAGEETGNDENEIQGEGGSVTINYPSILTTCFLPFSASTGDRLAVAPAIESLGRIDFEGNVYGWLAESFEVDPEELTVTILLKEGIQFSDGSNFDADAVIWNFEKMVEGGKASEIGSPVSYEKTDDYTVVLQYETWANDWEMVLSEVYIYCPAAFEENGEDWASINAVGTGPYIMSEYVKDDHISFTKNDNYWIEGKPYLDELNIVFMTDITTQQAAFMNGEIDLIISEDATLIQTLMSAGYKNIAQQAPELGSIKYIMFASGDESSPFHDLKVRQAVSHSIDWEGYVNSLTGNLGITVSQFGVPGGWSYDENATLPEYDVEKAKSLLAEAGYPDGFDTTISTIALNNDIAVLLQESLSQMGINAEIKVLESSEFNSLKKESTYDGGIITGQGSSKLDFTNNYIRLYSSQGLNYLNMMDHPADYEEALFGARSAETLEEKQRLLKIASTKLVNEYNLILPLGAIFSTCFTNDRVVDSGIYQVTGVIWTPEDIKIVE